MTRTREYANVLAGGFLEVGTTETGEVVVNHPDLKPDKHGVGHIVFSPEQARHFAKLLLTKAADADTFLNTRRTPRVLR